MKIYISGPLTGRPNLNREAFAAVAVMLQERGYETVNPHDLNPAEPEPGVTFREHYTQCMRTDIVALLDCDAIYMLRDWASSSGAMAERTVAKAIGLAFFDRYNMPPRLAEEAELAEEGATAGGGR